jgi:O-antigen/teichoic acid export membrane protein
MRRSLRHNFVVVLAGSGAASLLSALLLVVFAKTGSAAVVGQYAFAIAIVQPVMAFAGLQLRALQVADPNERHPFVDYYVVRVGATLLATLAVVGASVWVGPKQAAVVSLVAIIKAVDAVSDIYFGRWQQLESMGRSALGVCLNGAATLVVAGTAMALTGSLTVALSGSLVASLATLTYAVAVSRHVAKVEWKACNLQRARRLLIRAVPLGVVVLLVALQANVPRYFVGLMLGDTPLGVLAGVTQLTTAGGIVVAALGAASSPRLARSIVEGRLTDYCGLLKRLLWIGAGLGVAGTALAVVGGRQILDVAFSSEFAAGWSLLVWASASCMFGFAASVLGYGMTTAGIIGVQPLLLFITIVTTGIGCRAFIPVYGLTGAGIGLSFGALVQFVGSAAIMLNRATSRADARLHPGGQ